MPSMSLHTRRLTTSRSSLATYNAVNVFVGGVGCVCWSFVASSSDDGATCRYHLKEGGIGLRPARTRSITRAFTTTRTAPSWAGSSTVIALVFTHKCIYHCMHALLYLLLYLRTIVLTTVFTRNCMYYCFCAQL